MLSVIFGDACEILPKNYYRLDAFTMLDFPQISLNAEHSCNAPYFHVSADHAVNDSLMQLQNVKAGFDAAIRVVIKPPQKQTDKKKKAHWGCLV